MTSLTVGDEPAAWAAAGFAVDAGGGCRIGGLRVDLVGRAGGVGVRGWTLATTGGDSDGGDVDGIATTWTDAPEDPGAEHPNGVTGIDHLVLLTPHLERTLAALGAVGLEPRLHRDGEMGGRPVRQVFFRAGVTLEVVGDPNQAGEGATRIWGITHTVGDLDATAGMLAAHLGRVKDAVQPGRRIATLRHRDLDMSVATAFISPRPPRC